MESHETREGLPQKPERIQPERIQPMRRSKAGFKSGRYKLKAPPRARKRRKPEPEPEPEPEPKSQCAPEHNPDAEHEALCIREKRVRGKEKFGLVLWLGGEETLEPWENLKNAPLLKKEFKENCEEDSSRSESSWKIYISKKLECPICWEPIDQHTRRGLHPETPFGTETYEQKMNICRTHLENEWMDRGYPKIDWNDLERRATRFLPELCKIMEGTRISRYQATFYKNRQARQTALAHFGNLPSMGYYGLRGHMIFLKFLTRELSTKIRNCVGFTEAAGYTQEVLVPEVIMRLIAEDQGWKIEDGPLSTNEEEQAMRIMKESARLGERLYPSNDDEDNYGWCSDEEDDNGDWLTF